MNASADHRRFVPGEDVVSQAVHDELVLLDLAAGEYVGLNAVGARLWGLLVQGHSLEAAQAALLDAYDVAPERLRADLEAMLADLLGRGLLREAP